jgi:hypothetical protein
MDYEIKISRDQFSGDFNVIVWEDGKLVESVKTPAAAEQKLKNRVDALILSSKRSCYGFEALELNETKVIRRIGSLNGIYPGFEKYLDWFFL